MSSERTSDNKTAKKVLAMKKRWNPSMIIQGQIHHYIGHLMPDPNQQANLHSFLSYSLISLFLPIISIQVILNFDHKGAHKWS